MALYLLERDRAGGRTLSRALLQAIERVGECQRCRNLSEEPLCPICADETEIISWCAYWNRRWI